MSDEVVMSDVVDVVDKSLLSLLSKDELITIIGIIHAHYDKKIQRMKEIVLEEASVDYVECIGKQDGCINIVSKLEERFESALSPNCWSCRYTDRTYSAVCKDCDSSKYGFIHTIWHNKEYEEWICNDCAKHYYKL